MSQVDTMRSGSRFYYLILLNIFVVAVFAAGVAESADKARWTASKLHGSPDAPMPYRIKPAYAKLKFDRPVLIEPVPGSNDMLVGEVGGNLVLFEDREDVSSTHSIGNLKSIHPDCTALYGLAFHPKYPADRRIYICYVVGGELPEGTRVSEFKMSETTPPKLIPESERRILTWKGGGHNGGALAFGPDGMLYISTGDAGPASPPDILRTGQDVTDLLSSVLRIDIEKKSEKLGYGIPADNPFVGMENVRPELWAYGFRNPWKITFDSKTGDLWVGDVGWELWELVYRVEKGGNYGWSAVEGRQPVLQGVSTGPSPIRPPTIDHPHSEAASITGGYVYHGKSLPKLAGAYIYGDYQSGYVWAARWDGNRVSKLEKIAETGLRLVSFGLDHAGELLLVEHERTNQLFRLEAVPAAELDDSSRKFPLKLSETGIFNDLTKLEPNPGIRDYSINAPAWADGATAKYVMALPPGHNVDIEKASGRWRLPDGSVLAKTVSLKVATVDKPRRMETQVLLKQEGAWAAYSYVWNEAQTEATLAPAEGASIPVVLRDVDSGGATYNSRYRVASRAECVLCHNPWVEARTTVYGRQSASPLGMLRAQLDYPDSQRHKAYQDLASWATGTDQSIPEPEINQTLVAVNDAQISPERRARSWLQVNCAQCHNFNAGGAATIILDAAAKTADMKMVGIKPQQGDLGLGSDAMLISPGHPHRSVLMARIAKMGPGHMPRLGSREIDRDGVGLVAAWIEALGKLPTESSKTASADPAIDKLVAELASSGDQTAEDLRLKIQKLGVTPQGALALSRLELASPSSMVGKMIREEVAELTQPEVRDYLERFLPRSARLERLGDGFSHDEVLSLAGSKVRGETLFAKDNGPNCISCHAIGGKGRNVGPVLDGIGDKYDSASLLRHIVEPALAVEPQWRTVTVACRDGRVFTGLKQTLEDGRIKVIDAKSETILDPKEIERMDTASISLMPVGLLRDLTAEQAADLIAYLSSLKNVSTRETK